MGDITRNQFRCLWLAAQGAKIICDESSCIVHSCSVRQLSARSRNDGQRKFKEKSKGGVRDLLSVRRFRAESSRTRAGARRQTCPLDAESIRRASLPRP